MVKALMVKAHN